MKFDEHVYYMAGLFCCNIAASLALMPAVLLAELRGSAASRRISWAATAGLAAATIVGFLWSRTIGFPQMADAMGGRPPPRSRQTALGAGRRLDRR